MIRKILQCYFIEGFCQELFLLLWVYVMSIMSDFMNFLYICHRKWNFLSSLYWWKLGKNVSLGNEINFHIFMFLFQIHNFVLTFMKNHFLRFIWLNTNRITFCNNLGVFWLLGSIAFHYSRVQTHTVIISSYLLLHWNNCKPFLSLAEIWM